jgi:hypothetical protein
MLAGSEGRGRIRRLPAAQLFFSLKELDDDEVSSLLPHLTEEQWAAVLDLEIWHRDRLSLPALLGWQRHLLTAEDPVARKLVRATDPEIWELAFRKGMVVFARSDPDEFEGEPGDGEIFETPDGQFLVELNCPSDQARILRALVLRLYALDSESAAVMLQEARFRSPMELEEEAYQSRRRRVEDLGFPDYYDALSVYTPLRREDRLLEKVWSGEEFGPGELPVPTGMFQAYGPLLLFRALAAGSRRGSLEPLVEELFLLCNKVLAADRISPGDAGRIRQGIRKTVCGVNLGLSLWSADDLEKAETGVRNHFLVQFFQLGYGALTELREMARNQLPQEPEPSASHRWRGLTRGYPILLRSREGRLRYRYLSDRRDWTAAVKWLNRNGLE